MRDVDVLEQTAPHLTGALRGRDQLLAARAEGAEQGAYQVRIVVRKNREAVAGAIAQRTAVQIQHDLSDLRSGIRQGQAALCFDAQTLGVPALASRARSRGHVGRL